MVDLDPEPTTDKAGRTHTFAPGDMVQVVEGELMHLEGKIISIDRNEITMMPKHEDLTEALRFPARELRKSFKVGDHVKDPVLKTLFFFLKKFEKLQNPPKRS